MPTLSQSPGGQRYQLLILFAVCAACCLPFINKAFYIDSDMMVHMSEQMLANPLNPLLGDYGRHMALHDHTAMPRQSVFYRSPHQPLLPLLLAPVALVAHGKEWPYHAVMLLFCLAAVAAVWALFGLLFPPRLRFPGTLMFAVSPVLLVNSQNIMWDVPVAAMQLWAVVLLLYGLRKNSAGLVFLCGIVTGIAGATKMSSLPMYALAGSYLLITRKWRYLAWWCCGAFALPLAWIIHNVIVFGQVQYLSTGHFHPIIGDVRYRFERVLGYVGGGVMLPLWLFWLIFRSRQRTIWYCLLAVPVLLWSGALFFVLKKPPALSASYFFFASAGLWVLAWSFAEILQSKQLVCRYHERLLCAGFLALNCFTMLFLPTAGTRYVVPVVPFVIIPVLSITAAFSKREFRWYWISALALELVLSVLLCASDDSAAGADRSLPAQLKLAGYDPAKTWYYGRMSYDYYLYKNGFRNLRADNGTPAAGEYCLNEIIPGDYNAPAMLAAQFSVVAVDTISAGTAPLRLEPPLGGFHGDTRIPYALSFATPLKEYVIFRIVEKK
jgi:hypothetical protein